MIQVLPEPEPGELAALSQRVLRNNGLIPVARGPLTEGKKVVAPGLGVPSPMIEHVVFITKENHTFDGIFGELKGARGNADFAHYGRNGWIQAKGRDLRLPIMPNHLKLAEEFAICDNFYMEPQASGAMATDGWSESIRAFGRRESFTLVGDCGWTTRPRAGSQASVAMEARFPRTTSKTGASGSTSTETGSSSGTVPELWRGLRATRHRRGVDDEPSRDLLPDQSPDAQGPLRSDVL